MPVPMPTPTPGNPGMSPQLIAAMQARMQGGQPTPQLSQVSPGTPQGAPMAPPPAPAPQPVSSATSGMPQGINQSMGKGQPPSSEVEMLIKALSQSDRLPMKAMSDRLKFLSAPPSLPANPATNTAGPSPVAGNRTAFQIRNDMPGGMQTGGGGDFYTGGGYGTSTATNGGGGNSSPSSSPISGSISPDNPYARLKDLYDSFMSGNPQQQSVPGMAAGGVQ